MPARRTTLPQRSGDWCRDGITGLMQRPIPEYGVEPVPPLRRRLLSIGFVVAGTFAFLILVGVVTFRRIVPAPVAPAAVPVVPATVPATSPAAV